MIKMDGAALSRLAEDIVEYVRERAHGNVTPTEAIAATAAAAVLVEGLMVAEGPRGPNDETAKAIARAAFDRGVEIGRKFGVMVKIEPEGPPS